MSSAQPSQDGKVNSTQDEDKENLKDGDMLDSGGNDSAQAPTGQADTRRKKKRFRLTRQQTQFLMSEFVKQPQPDAAHYEHLSREIPGHSQRQVQVWFQNRRGRMKRLNPADRDRMVATRAAPEGLDNVRALHAFDGTVHGIDVPMSSPGTSSMQSCALQMLMPLIPETRKYNTSERASLMAMTFGLSAMTYSPTGSMTSPSLELSFSPAPSYQRTHDSLPDGQQLTAHLGNTRGIGLSSSYIDPALFDPTSSSS